MRRLADLRAAAAALTLAAALSAMPVSLAGASPVDDQERKVDQIADQLERTQQRYDELSTELATAEAAKAELDAQIADAGARVAELEAQVGELQRRLTDVAVDVFMRGGSDGVTPIFGDSASLTDGLAREHLTRVALDLGDADVDEYDSVLLDLAEERADLEEKQAQATAYAEQIASAQSETERLHNEYEAEYTAAQAELGQLLEEEEQRRAEEAYARMLAEQEAARRAAAQQQPTVTSGPARGGGAAGGGASASSGGSGNGSGGGASAASSGGSNGGSSGSSGSSGASSTPPAVLPSVSSNASVAINAAMGQLGVPYRFAASQPGVAFDCSGLTAYAWGRAGVSLPHQSAQQYASTPHVPKDQAQPGDLIFYYSPIGHVAIYLGGGQMIHAPRTGDVVKIAAVNWGKVVGVSRPG